GGPAPRRLSDRTITTGRAPPARPHEEDSPVRILTTCPWCHALVDAGPCRPAFCQCGHRADLPRGACDCARGSGPLPRARPFTPDGGIDLATGEVFATRDPAQETAQ